MDTCEFGLNLQVVFAKHYQALISVRVANVSVLSVFACSRFVIKMIF